MRAVSVGECMVELAPSTKPGLYQRGFAGDTFNTAWYLRGLLPQSAVVDYVTMVGTDAMSDQLWQFMTDHGIGTRHIRRHPFKQLGQYRISLNNGERSFRYDRDTSAARHLADDVPALQNAVAGADLIYFSGITLAILDDTARAALLATIANSPAQIAFDPNYRPALWASPAVAQTWITRAAHMAHIVLPSFEDEAALFGDQTPETTARRYMGHGCAEVVVKTGGNPIILAGKDGLTAYPVTPYRAIDTTGAGDSFNGAYLCHRLCGASPTHSIVQAHRLAARVIAHKGALLPMPF